jgi:hypothetical protein
MSVLYQYGKVRTRSRQGKPSMKKNFITVPCRWGRVIEMVQTRDPIHPTANILQWKRRHHPKRPKIICKSREKREWECVAIKPIIQPHEHTRNSERVHRVSGTYGYISFAIKGKGVLHPKGVERGLKRI